MITSPKLSVLVSGLVVAIAGMGSAHAVGPITAGNYKVSFDNYDSGTTGYGNTPGVKCTTVSDVGTGCDHVVGISKAIGSFGSVNTSADTMGIFSVSNITNVTTGVTEYIKGTSTTIGGVMFGPFLTGIFSNLMDKRVEVGTLFGSTFTDIRSVGGTFSLWSNAADYNPVHGPGVTAGVDLNDMRYTGVNNPIPGTLFLSGIFAPGGAVGGDLTSTYSSNYNNRTISGVGFGALDFTGGSALSFFNTNSYTNVNGGMNDAYLTASFNPSAAVPNWEVISTGQFIGALAIPEPGSLLLASLALLGMGVVTRRAMKR